MEWRIRKSGHGGFVAEKGIYHKGGESFPGIIGVTMPTFFVYESAHFQTEKEAKNYIKGDSGHENRKLNNETI